MKSSKRIPRNPIQVPVNHAPLGLPVEEPCLGSQAHNILRCLERRDAPLSTAQQWWWDIVQSEPDRHAYNQAMALRLDGDLNVHALEKAINAIVKRLEVLRTVISQVDHGFPVKCARQTRCIKLPIVDLSKRGECEESALRAISASTRCTFNAGAILPLRARLIKLNPDQHVLIVVRHKITGDEQSNHLFWGELARLYTEFARGKPNRLPRFPIQYADYAAWQRQRLQEKASKAQLAHRKRQLLGLCPIKLPTDRPRQTVQSQPAATQFFVLPKAVADQLYALSRREGATLFVTLLAAFKVFLHRYTAQEDIAVGSPTAGRSHAETTGLIGRFANTRVLRTDLSGNPFFREILSRVQRSCLEAYGHQDLPFEVFLEEIYHERNGHSASPINVMFALDNESGSPLKMPGLAATPLELENSTTIYDLFAAFKTNRRHLILQMKYSTDLFDHGTIGRMMGHFQTLLEGIVADPDRRLSELPLLSEQQTHPLLVEWNDTQKDLPKDKCVHELIEDQAEKTPDAVALVCPSTAQGEEQQLSYRELNSRANQLAHYLRKLGVGPEVLVGLYMERSPEMIIALLAVHKAGGAYVPLDPNYPLQRLLVISEEAQFSVILSQQRLAESFPAHTAKVICLDTGWPNIDIESKENPVPRATPDDLAYVVYISSSAGRPTGVEITHRSLSNFVCWAASAYELTPSDRVLQFASMSCDTAVEEIFPCLASGAQLVLHSDSMSNPLTDLLQRCRDWRVSVVDLPTAYWHELVEAISPAPPTKLDKLRLVIVSGEQASTIHLTRWRKAIGDQVRLANTYGPTEATVVSTLWDSRTAMKRDQPSAEIRLGRPIANTQVYILDEHLNPVPVGVPGEIYISGVGLARGYFNSPELTARQFIAHSFSRDTHARLYKTGDSARYRPDGNIELVRRLDDQIKIGGFRVELREIETTLRQHQSVRDAVVLARADVSCRRRLVAYVAAYKGAAPTASELTGFLRALLPYYMVPSSFIFIKHPSMTPNGKIDRQACTALDQDCIEPKNGFVAPRSQDEKIITDIWAEILNIKQIGIYDDFFELGNHSTLAIQLVHRIRNVFSLDLSLQELFHVPTVEGMAATVGQKRSERSMQQGYSEVALLPKKEMQRSLSRN
jgi:amino acid adenylation domain-containing protein